MVITLEKIGSMKLVRLYITVVTLVFVAVCGGMAAQQTVNSDITVTASLDRDTIGLDEQAMLSVVVSGAVQNLPEPKMPTLSRFEVYSQGRSSSFRVSNGVMSSSNTYRYLILPKEPGTYPIDQIAVVFQNRRYKAEPLELTVVGKSSTATPRLTEKARESDGKSRDYFMEAVVDNPTPFVNEQVTLTLKFYIAIQYYGSPELIEPTTTGFWTEVLGNKAPYYQKINGRNYKVIERKYALFPTQTGKLDIGRAMIRLKVPSRNRRSDDIFSTFFGQGEDVSVRSQVVTVDVQPLPTKGKPDNFTGTIGNFRIYANADKREVEANQPVSVTIKISGTGNIKSVAEPELAYDDNEFRVYRASSNENVSKVSNKIGGTKIFEEVFIPKRPGVVEIPAISYNYFDPEQKKYRTISTNPIKVNVTKPEGYVDAPNVPYNATSVIGSESNDIRFIKNDIGDLHTKESLILVSPLYVLVNGLPVLLLAGLVVIRKRNEMLAGNIGLARSRAAVKEAKRRLAKAKKIADEGNSEALFLEIYTAITSFIADKLNISPHGLTTDKIAELLREHQADPDVVDKIIEVLKQADFARFAPATLSKEDIERAVAEAEEAMVKIYEIKF